MTKTPAAGDKPTAESLLDSEADLASALVQEEIDARYAAQVDPHHPILTVAEQIAALKEAEIAVDLERKKQAKADFVKREKERLLGAGGQLTGDPRKDERVYVTIDLAEYTDRITLGFGGEHAHVYMHGQTYQVARHVADTLREICARSHAHQNELDGKGLAERLRRPQAKVLSGATNA